MKLLMYLSILLLTSGCVSTKQSSYNPQVLLPVPYDIIDPPDQYAIAAVNSFLKQTGSPAASTYKISRFDLNNDGRREALILFKTPYGYWCDVNGCTMAVFQAHDDNFEYKGKTYPIRGPLFVSKQTNNGWKDLIARVSGRWSKTKDVLMSFDGRQYPTSPENLPAHSRHIDNEEARLFYR